MNQELTKAAQQALEVLKTYRDAYNQAWVPGMDILEPDGDKSINELERALTQRPAAQDTVVRVCPFKDAECGDRPASWCDTCPKRPAAQTEREAFEAWAKLNNVQLTLDVNQRDYHYPQARAGWSAWQTRASMPAPQRATPEPVGEAWGWAIEYRRKPQTVKITIPEDVAIDFTSLVLVSDAGKAVSVAIQEALNKRYD